MKKLHVFGVLLSFASVMVLQGSIAHADPDTDLAAALRAGNFDGVAAALDAGAAVEGAGTVAPLYIASLRGDTEIVQALLDANASPNPVDSQGRSALVRALLRKHFEVAALLIEAGADVNLAETQPGRSPLQLIIDEAPSLDAMEMLLVSGADINHADLRGETAVASAAFMNRPDAVDLLIERGAQINTRNNNGVSPFEWARQQGNDAIISRLQAAGAVD